MQKQILIHDAAFYLKVPTETLRRWDKKEILCAKRKKNGYRYYTPAQLEKAKKTLVKK